jgi:hypothetical protein
VERRIVARAFTASIAIAAILVIAETRPTSHHVMSPAPPPISASPAAVDPVALDTQDCIKSSQTLQDLAQAIADAGGAHGPAVVTAAAYAETRAVFSDVKDAVSALAESTRRGGDAKTAVGRLLTLIDQLDARCQAALNRH